MSDVIHRAFCLLLDGGATYLAACRGLKTGETLAVGNQLVTCPACLAVPLGQLAAAERAPDSGDAPTPESPQD